MTKTDKMRMIELLAGKDIRQVLSEAYADGGTIQRAAEIIRDRYDVDFSFGLFSDWVEVAGGEYEKALVFPDFMPATEDGEAVAA